MWLEIHVDDEIVAAQPERWPEARALLDRVARVAEERGARLCFRFREASARASRDDGLLPQLVDRGHEVGVHAHGRRLAQATAAVRACGVEPAAAVPGLVQVGATGRPPLLRQVASLGLGVVTDHGASPAWAYDGLLPRREHGVTVMAPSVRPFDWGLMERDGTRNGLGPAATARLRALEEVARAQDAAWFGAALHEHDLCAPGSLSPAAASLDALARYLDPRVGPATRRAPTASPPPSRPLGDGRIRVDRLTAGLLHRVRGALPPVRLTRPTLEKGGHRLDLRVGGRRLAVQRYGPRRPKAACVVSAAGSDGGRRLGLSPFGARAADLALRGWSVWCYDRAGTGGSPARDDPALTPGNPAHDRDWAAVLERAGEDGCPRIALTWSGGLIAPLRAAAGGARPDALVDGEGPADRWSLVPPTGNELSARDPWDDRDWDGIEARALLPALGAPYARLQGERDHLHGPMTHHARRMAEAADLAGLEQRPLRVVEGALASHPFELVEALQWCLRRVRGW